MAEKNYISKDEFKNARYMLTYLQYLLSDIFCEIFRNKKPEDLISIVEQQRENAYEVFNVLLELNLDFEEKGIHAF